MQVSKERLEELAKFYGGFSEMESSVAVELSGALRELLDRRQREEWISVEERLPEDGETVITCRSEMDKDWSAVCKFYGKESPIGFSIWFKPTHWKHLVLPSAPTKEGE
jgi:hypothetical protein